MIGITQAIGAIASIINKLTPNRLQRQNKELRRLEHDLQEAMLANDSIRIASVNKRMRQLRHEISNTYIN